MTRKMLWLAVGMLAACTTVHYESPRALYWLGGRLKHL